MNCENKKTRADALEEKHLSWPFFAGEREGVDSCPVPLVKREKIEYNTIL